MWVRGVGGVVDIKSSSATSVVRNPIVVPAIDQGTVNCTSKSHETFAGVQLGQDISRLNIGNGWNVHLGTTAGYLSARATDKEGPGTFKTNFEVPFFGTYGVITKGGFFADAMVRGEYYNIELNQPALNLWNQQFGARGVSVTANAGYNFPLQNNWFIEPSAGFIWSEDQGRLVLASSAFPAPASPAPSASTTSRAKSAAPPCAPAPRSPAAISRCSRSRRPASSTSSPARRPPTPPPARTACSAPSTRTAWSVRSPTTSTLRAPASAPTASSPSASPARC